LEKGKCGLIFGVGLSEEAKKQEEREDKRPQRKAKGSGPTSWRQQTESMSIRFPFFILTFFFSASDRLLSICQRCLMSSISFFNWGESKPALLFCCLL